MHFAFWGEPGALASLSCITWWAHERSIPLRRTLGKPFFQPLDILIILVTVQAHQAW